MRTFDFGANWQAFSEQHMNTRRVAHAKDSLRALLQRHSLAGSSFLDVGCGSGMFAIAAHQMGAQPVVGIDISERCVAVSEQNRRQLAPRAGIVFQQASALDQPRMAALGEFDVVYAWGSLHHTGALWEAIRQVTQRVAPDGVLVLAIANKHWTSPYWKALKGLYNLVPRFVQRWMERTVGRLIYVGRYLSTGRDPHQTERGMDFWHDVVNWIGGYPYEYATMDEIEAFLRDHGFVLRRSFAAASSTGCNEFVFERSAAEI